jgi:hypothetical protein
MDRSTTGSPTTPQKLPSGSFFIARSACLSSRAGSNAISYHDGNGMKTGRK